MEELIEFGTVDDSKVEDVVAATTAAADSAQHVDQHPPAKRKIPYVKPGTENGGEQS